MRTHRATVIGITAASAAAAVISIAAPASAAPPPSPGCTFDNGQTTCVTTSTSTNVWGPGTATGATSDGSLPAQWCLGSSPAYLYYQTINGSFWQLVTTTHTVVRRGAPNANGAIVSDTSTSSTGPVYITAVGSLECAFSPF